MRILAPVIGQELGEQVDQLLLETFQNLFAMALSVSQARQLRFRLSRGGLGLRARGGCASSVAFLGSWGQAASTVFRFTGWAPVLTGNVDPISNALLQAGREVQAAAGSPLPVDVTAQDFWDCARGYSTVRLQNTLHKSIEKAAVDQWLAGAGAEARANLHSCSGWGAGVALIRCPTERALQFSDLEFRSAVAERLLVPRVPEGRCPRVFSTGAT